MYRRGACWIDSDTVNYCLDIMQAVELCPELLRASNYVLITGVDSGVELTSDDPQLIKALAATDAEIDTVHVGGALMLDIDSFKAILETHLLLFGFDEVWFCKRQNIEPFPSGIVFHAGTWLQCEIDDDSASAQEIDALTRWMAANDVIAGLSDGVGLNFISLNQPIAERLDTIIHAA